MNSVDTIILAMREELRKRLEAGTSSKWVGEKDGKPYIFWMEGKKLRSRRLKEGINEAKTAHNNFVQARWLRSRIEEAIATRPKSVS